MEALRSTIRRCAHAVLVAVDCMAGGACPASGTGPGRYVVVRPCDRHRRPLGRGLVAGPLHEQRDVDDLCRWMLESATAPFPGHLYAGPAVLGRASA